MGDQLQERIAKALENDPLPSGEAVAYRSSLQAADPTEVTSMISVTIFRPDHYRSFAVQGRFSNASGIATIAVIRGYSPTGTTSFVALGCEYYGLSAVSSGLTISGKYLSDDIAFSAWRASGLKITLQNSVSAGTVDLWVKRY